MRSAYPNLTLVRCDCCDGTFRDEVAALMIEDATATFRDALVAKAEDEKDAWADADRIATEALRKATGGAP